MEKNGPTLEGKREATGTWNVNLPLNFFSRAAYRMKDGKVIHLPVSVTGEKITGELTATVQAL